MKETTESTTPPQSTEIECKEIEELHAKTTRLTFRIDEIKPLVEQHERELGHWDLGDDPKILEALWHPRHNQESLYTPMDRSVEKQLLARREELLRRRAKPAEEVAIIGDLIARRRLIEFEKQEEQEWLASGKSRWRLNLIRRWRKLGS